jgi:hypothetical protein
LPIQALSLYSLLFPANTGQHTYNLLFLSLSSLLFPANTHTPNERECSDPEIERERHRELRILMKKIEEERKKEKEEVEE